jgi:hypothetical protein
VNLVIGSMTNEGQVDICNLTMAIQNISSALSVDPSWLPTYPPNTSFKAGSYFPFTIVIPQTNASSTYPQVQTGT